MMNRISDTVKHLIIINVIFFAGSLAFGNIAFEKLSIWYPENDNFKVWQIFTHMFMHHPTFYLHIIANMFGLWMFGTPLEQIWGQKKFLFFYFSAGLGAVLLPFIIDYIQFNSIINEIISTGMSKNDILDILNQGKYATSWNDSIGVERVAKLTQIFNGSSLGASGAVMGLVAAFGWNFPNAKMALIFLPIPIAAKYFIPALLAYEIYSGITGGNSIFGVNVAHFAHVGGAITGFIIAWFWKKNQFTRWN
ncbi:MAG: rhomboid family intramembrane serine protease [Flavobacteriaceae bacterium]|nr:rhomboid family intramembrane serine protease [Flavobacteriaceae bacterium]